MFSFLIISFILKKNQIRLLVRRDGDLNMLGFCIAPLIYIKFYQQKKKKKKKKVLDRYVKDTSVI